MEKGVFKFLGWKKIITGWDQLDSGKIERSKSSRGNNNKRFFLSLLV
jgi:hypothetical protein